MHGNTMSAHICGLWTQFITVRLTRGLAQTLTYSHILFNVFISRKTPIDIVCGAVGGIEGLREIGRKTILF